MKLPDVDMEGIAGGQWWNARSLPRCYSNLDCQAIVRGGTAVTRARSTPQRAGGAGIPLSGLTCECTDFQGQSVALKQIQHFAIEFLSFEIFIRDISSLTVEHSQRPPQLPQRKAPPCFFPNGETILHPGKATA